ncbi:hypothetical protein PO124_13210 [Bacillus licheniformis]|nr:hypothetical protein [Bacillus licheniformis]
MKMAAEKYFENKSLEEKNVIYETFHLCLHRLFMVAALGISGIIAPKAAAASKHPLL